MFLIVIFKKKVDISNPKSTILKIDFPQIYHKLKKLIDMAPNLPEQPTKKESKIKETLNDQMRFLKGFVYLTKKIFML